MNVGILGTGRVAPNLATGLARGGHAVKLGSRAPAGKEAPAKGVTVGSLAEAAAFGDVVILAVPYSAVKEAVNAVDPKALKGKAVVDATNVFGPGGWAIGFTTSGAEELAKLVPGAHVVKAFNTVFAANMSTGKVGNERLTSFAAGDNPAAKQKVLQLSKDLGFDPVDAGPLTSARYLEPMGFLNIHLAFDRKMGTGIGFRLARA